jgi:hypothetical protein
MRRDLAGKDSRCRGSGYAVRDGGLPPVDEPDVLLAASPSFATLVERDVAPARSRAKRRPCRRRWRTSYGWLPAVVRYGSVRVAEPSAPGRLPAAGRSAPSRHRRSGRWCCPRPARRRPRGNCPPPTRCGTSLRGHVEPWRDAVSCAAREGPGEREAARVAGVGVERVETESFAPHRHHSCCPNARVPPSDSPKPSRRPPHAARRR